MHFCIKHPCTPYVYCGRVGYTCAPYSIRTNKSKHCELEKASVDDTKTADESSWSIFTLCNFARSPLRHQTPTATPKPNWSHLALDSFDEISFFSSFGFLGFCGDLRVCNLIDCRTHLIDTSQHIFLVIERDKPCHAHSCPPIMIVIFSWMCRDLVYKIEYHLVHNLPHVLRQLPHTLVSMSWGTCLQHTNED